MTPELQNKIDLYQKALEAFLDWSKMSTRIKSEEGKVRNNLNLARRELRAFELEIQTDIV